MRALLRIVAAVLAAIVFSLTYLIALALESRRGSQFRWAGARQAESTAPVPSETDS